jgi:putative DNA primase/helicase
MAETTDDNRKDRREGKDRATQEGAAGENADANSIEWATRSAHAPSGKARREKRARTTNENLVEGVPKEKPKESRTSRVPDSVHERFIQIGNNFYFPDGAQAFTRSENRLTTRSENAIVIQSMVAIAREESEKGVVKVRGSDFFKKEAWFAESFVGLEVEGYSPTELERERLVRAVAARRGETPKDPESQVTKDKSVNTQELITGRLVDHGPAPYQHNPKETLSYFVRVETDKGDRDIWGVDLERAFRQSLSNPGIGDQIGIRALGKEAVTVHSGGREIDTHRNQWSVERKEFLDQRRDMAAVFRDSSISESEGIKRHSALEGSYRTLEMGETHAQEQYTRTTHRAQFVEHLREYLARGIEFGRPLEAAQPHAREERIQEPREPDRDYHPTR